VSEEGVGFIGEREGINLSEKGVIIGIVNPEVKPVYVEYNSGHIESSMRMGITSGGKEISHIHKFKGVNMHNEKNSETVHMDIEDDKRCE
jgi:hypothetical protein